MNWELRIQQIYKKLSEDNRFSTVTLSKIGADTGLSFDGTSNKPIKQLVTKLHEIITWWTFWERLT